MKPARIAIVALWLLGLVGCAAWLGRHLSVNTDMTVFLPPSVTAEQRLLMRQLRDGVASRLILISIEGARGAEAARTSRELARRLAQTGLFSFVGNGDPGALRLEQEIVLRHRYLLSPAVAPERFSVAGLQTGLAHSLEVLASHAGAVLRPILPSDPTGEVEQVLGVVTPQAGPVLRHGVWLSADESRALLVAHTAAAGFDVEAQRRAIAAIEASFASLVASEGRIELSGPGVFASEIRERIQAESWRLSILAAFLVLLILGAAYRSVAVTAACAVPVAAGLLVGVSAVAAGFGGVHGITLAFGATLIGEAVDYPSYLFIHAAPGESLARTLERIGPTLRLAVLTTIFGALTMALSSFEGLAQLGVLTIAGVTAAGATTLWVLPRLVPESVLRRKAQLAELSSIPHQALAGARWPAIALTVVALAFLILQREQLWDDDLAHLSPVSESSKALDRRLRADIGAPDVRYLMLARADEREAALQRSESLAQWLQQRVARGYIDGFDVPSTYLPSRRLQQSRRAALPDAPTLERNLKIALRDSPFREDAFGPFLKAVESARSGALLEPESLQGSLFGLRVSALLVEDAGGWTALAPLRGVKDPAALAREAARDGYPLLDLKQEANRLVNNYRAESLRLFALSLLCIVGLLALSLRSLGRAARVLLPVVAAAVLDIALLVLLGRALSLFNLVALLLVIGVGLNYALFFERRAVDDSDRARTRLSVAVCGATTLAVFGCLMLSQTPVLKSIGETVFFGCLLSLVLSAALCGGYTRKSV